MGPALNFHTLKNHVHSIRCAKFNWKALLKLRNFNQERAVAFLFSACIERAKMKFHSDSTEISTVFAAKHLLWYIKDSTFYLRWYKSCKCLVSYAESCVKEVNKNSVPLRFKRNIHY